MSECPVCAEFRYSSLVSVCPICGAPGKSREVRDAAEEFLRYFESLTPLRETSASRS
jgi:hypothetical protein